MLTDHQEILQDHDTANRLFIIFDPKMGSYVPDPHLCDRARVLYSKIGTLHEARFASVSRAQIREDKKRIIKFSPMDELDVMRNDYEEELRRLSLAKLEDLEDRYGIR